MDYGIRQGQKFHYINSHKTHQILQTFLIGNF